MSQENNIIVATEPKPKHAGGRPTSYKREYCDQLIEFFSVPAFRMVCVKRTTRTNKSGQPDVVEEFEEKGEMLPMFTDFARKIGVTGTAIFKWLQKYPEFKEAYEVAKDLQKNHLIQNGCQGNYNAAFGIFTAKNITDMRDQVVVPAGSGDNHYHFTTIQAGKMEAVDLMDLILGRKNGHKAEFNRQAANKAKL